MTIRDRAAKALDMTHGKTMTGLNTERARASLAAYLDGALNLRASLVRRLCAYLEMIAR